MVTFDVPDEFVLAEMLAQADIAIWQDGHGPAAVRHAVVQPVILTDAASFNDLHFPSGHSSQIISAGVSSFLTPAATSLRVSSHTAGLQWPVYKPVRRIAGHLGQRLS